MKLSTEQLKELRVLCNDSTAWASVLDELIAIRELKGDQVPVAYTDTLSLETLQGNGMACMWKQGNGAEWREQIPLFTASQKPVVLPKEIEPYEVKTILDPTANVDEYSECVGADMWNAAIRASRKAIEAAGGIVKDGE